MTTKTFQLGSPFKQPKNLQKLKIDRRLVNRVLSVVDAGLCGGLGTPQPGKMCVEAAVCYALGLPHSDAPMCVGKAVRTFKINLNDLSWPSRKARAKGMRKLAIAQLGSNQIDQLQFARAIANEVTKVWNSMCAVAGIHSLIMFEGKPLNSLINRFEEYQIAVKWLAPQFKNIINNALTCLECSKEDSASDTVSYFVSFIDNFFVLPQVTPGIKLQFLNRAAEIGLEALKDSPGYRFVPKD